MEKIVIPDVPSDEMRWATFHCMAKRWRMVRFPVAIIDTYMMSDPATSGRWPVPLWHFISLTDAQAGKVLDTLEPDPHANNTVDAPTGLSRKPAVK